MSFVPHNALTIKAIGMARMIQSNVGVSLPATSPEEATQKQIKINQYQGIWDTGATNSVITKKVIDELELKPTGAKEVYHAQGKTIANSYLVNIILPNQVTIFAINVTEGVLNEIDVLIGMDIITLGDFSITNKNRKTVMSFRVPSCKEIDYVPESDEYNHVMRNGNKKLKERFEAKYK